MLFLGAVVAAAGLNAQEFTASGGAMTTTDEGGGNSYSWQVDYRQNIGRYAAFSASWLNEGHVPGHHRDGWTMQAWGRLPVFADRVSLSFGLGSDRYYDTQPLPNGDSADVHGWAPIVSLAATYYTQTPWYVRFTANRVEPKDNIAVSTVAVGVGYAFGPTPRSKPAPGAAVPTADNDPKSALTVFIGQSVVNTFVSESAVAAAVEYRRALGEHWDWTLGWIYEGDPEIIRRNGLASQVWITSGDMDPKLTFGMGFGVYIYVDRKNLPPDEQNHDSALAGLVSPSVSYQLNRNWNVRFTWNRVLTDYHRDADVFLLGAGYCWGGRR